MHIRLPRSLRLKLEQRCETTGHAMNRQIVLMLKSCLNAPVPVVEDVTQVDSGTRLPWLED